MKRLLDFLRPAPRPAEQLPFDLTRAQLHDLDVLRHTPEWQTFLVLVDKALTLKEEQLLVPTPLNADATNFVRGEIHGARSTALLLDQILAKVSELDARPAAAAAPDHRRTFATYGSPAWGRDATR